MATEKKKGNEAPIRGELIPPGDKSVSHRSVMIGSLAKGTTLVSGFLVCEDTNSTLGAMKLLGVPIESLGTNVEIKGVGLNGLIAPEAIIDAGNSGTTARLIMGLLSPQRFTSEITGDQYLRARPMRRVVDPLRLMGADISGAEDGNKLPVRINGTELTGISYEPPVASAQVKSAVLLAGLYAKGVTEVTESKATRDHTERMLKYFGAHLETEKNTIRIERQEDFHARELLVPSDISSAAFFIVAALINPSSVFMAFILSVSFTLSSRASLMTVSPSEKQAATARTGSSSIALGITSPLISTPFRSLDFTSISATGSHPESEKFTTSISPPMSRRMSITPERRGFTPTFFKRSSESGFMSAATMKNAADDISEGTRSSLA